MTREEAKELLPIIQAFVEGKDVQFRTYNSDEWSDVINPLFNGLKAIEYRIKPEPTYRPFKNKEECWNEMLKHQPFSYLVDGNGNITQVNGLLTNASKEIFISLSCTIGILDSKYLFTKYKFVDGTPFGIKED